MMLARYGAIGLRSLMRWFDVNSVSISASEQGLAMSSHGTSAICAVTGLPSCSEGVSGCRRGAVVAMQDVFRRRVPRHHPASQLTPRRVCLVSRQLGKANAIASGLVT